MRRNFQNLQEMMSFTCIMLRFPTYNRYASRNLRIFIYRVVQKSGTSAYFCLYLINALLYAIYGQDDARQTPVLCVAPNIVVFTALHCMQRGPSYERLSVRPSVCPSVCLSNA